MKGDQIGTFQKIKGIFHYGRLFKKTFDLTGNSQSRHISKTKTLNQLDFFSEQSYLFLEQIAKSDQKQQQCKEIQDEIG